MFRLSGHAVPYLEIEWKVTVGTQSDRRIELDAVAQISLANGTQLLR